MRQDDQLSRPEAVRRLVDQALAGHSTGRRPSKKAAHKASELASREIEQVGDKSLPPEEQTRRKRRLIHGPKEFRTIRGDEPKMK